MSAKCIQSEGDLEVVVLYDLHALLTYLVSEELYTVLGSSPDQTVRFHNQLTYDLFLVRAAELSARFARSTSVEASAQTWSILDGAAWIVAKHGVEAHSSRLDSTVRTLRDWLGHSAPVSIWCSHLKTEVSVSMSRAQLLAVGASSNKLHVLRLGDLLSKLRTWCDCAGHHVTPKRAIELLQSMVVEVNSRVAYHLPYVVEMAGGLLLALHQLIRSRHRQSLTKGDHHVDYPDGLTSDLFRGLYVEVLQFAQLPDERIRRSTPTTPRHLRLKY